MTLRSVPVRTLLAEECVEPRIRISATDRFSPLVQELLAKLPNRSSKFVGLALCRLQDLAQRRCVHAKSLPALRAGEVRVSLEPSKAFAKFVAAVRANNVHAL